MKKKLKEEYQPGGSKRQEILNKAVTYILDPAFGTQNAKHAFLLEQVGLTESEYLTCLNKAAQGVWE
jgi:DNA replicative helicase MCM subunit Mcm2 (Cdc46/Mcm family)